ncbi:MAG TPA: exosortase-associated EpsI family protein [Armatimonadota bacterium]|nr:exosortase-associated EpsI family protein [Armatimonadota bacterium]
MPQHARRYLIPALVLLAGAAGAHTIRHNRPAGGATVDLSQIPLKLAGFQGFEEEPNASVFAYLGADQMLERYYVNAEKNQRVELSVVYARGWRALHSPRECFKNQGWSPVGEGDLETTDSPPRCCLRTGDGERRRPHRDGLHLRDGGSHQWQLAAP